MLSPAVWSAFFADFWGLKTLILIKAQERKTREEASFYGKVNLSIYVSSFPPVSDMDEEMGACVCVRLHAFACARFCFYFSVHVSLDPLWSLFFQQRKIWQSRRILGENRTPCWCNVCLNPCGTCAMMIEWPQQKKSRKSRSRWSRRLYIQIIVKTNSCCRTKRRMISTLPRIISRHCPQCHSLH